jgi:hypothetical protein
MTNFAKLSRSLTSFHRGALDIKVDGGVVVGGGGSNDRIGVGGDGHGRWVGWVGCRGWIVLYLFVVSFARQAQQPSKCLLAVLMSKQALAQLRCLSCK